MSHLHIPDGVLPVWLWGPAWIATIVILIGVWRTQRDRKPQRIAYEGALGALMLAAMAMEVPFGPLEYHLTLAGPVGILLGPAGAFQAAFIASAVLAFIGHGGLTLIGLNALLVGTAAVVSALAYHGIRGPRLGARGFAAATAIGHSGSGIAWLTLVLVSARMRATDLGLDTGGRLGLMSGVAIPMVLFGVLAESAVAFGLARFILKVRPDLLPGAVAAGEGESR